MKRIRQCLIAAAAFALIFGTAYADSTINAVVDDAASAIKVSGEFDNSAKDYVNIQILSGRYDAASFDELSEEEIYGKVKYFRQKSFADGNYEFAHSFNGEKRLVHGRCVGTGSKAFLRADILLQTRGYRKCHQHIQQPCPL